MFPRGLFFFLRSMEQVNDTLQVLSRLLLHTCDGIGKDWGAVTVGDGFFNGFDKCWHGKLMGREKILPCGSAEGGNFGVSRIGGNAERGNLGERGENDCVQTKRHDCPAGRDQCNGIFGFIRGYTLAVECSCGFLRNEKIMASIQHQKNWNQGLAAADDSYSGKQGFGNMRQDASVERDAKQRGLRRHTDCLQDGGTAGWWRHG